MIVLSAVVLVSGCVTVKITDSESSLQELEKIERARFQSWVQKDVPALQKVIADDVVYCHSTGVCQNKAELIDFIIGGANAYLAMDVIEIQPQAYGDAVVINGKLDVKVQSNGKPLSFKAVYTDFYVMRDGRWQLVRWQSTVVP
jgi:hypothetical protein